MPTTEQGPPELNDPDFDAFARSELDGCVRLRLLALVHLKEAKSPREIGARLKVHPKTVLKWGGAFGREV